MKTTRTPHKLHLFFCTNTRDDGKTSCGDTKDTTVLAERLKDRFKEERLPVRVTRSQCLGPCEKGPNIMCYPHEVWFQDVSEKDEEAIAAEVKRLLGSGTHKT
ncbi:MAG TPA: (2Fe-2S) ferredoxin domain-containing protein [Fibrobacteria bacterium]|nr:(2Fe-2S) ferredoxin domain-containing protein [Fibrobacteria bacterium]